MNRISGFLIFFIVFQILQSCKNQGKNLSNKIIDETYSIKEITKDSVNVSKEIVVEVVKSITNYTDLFWHTEALKLQYNASLLEFKAPETLFTFLKLKQKEDIFFKVFWDLGIYSYHLGYYQNHAKKDETEKYLQLIEKKMTRMNFEEGFDISTIRQSIKMNSAGSTMALIKLNLDNVYKQLSEYELTRMSVFMLSGAWLEHLYFICESIRQKPHKLEELRNYLQEQAIVLDQILLLLSFYEDKNSNAKYLMDEFFKIKKIYESEQISVETIACLLFETDFSNPEVLNNLIQTTTEIRNKILIQK